MIFKQGIPYIKYECENKHKNKISLIDYITKSNKFTFLKKKCNKCSKNIKEIKGDFFIIQNEINFYVMNV